jgi:hypothetical protein
MYTKTWRRAWRCPAAGSLRNPLEPPPSCRLPPTHLWPQETMPTPWTCRHHAMSQTSGARMVLKCLSPARRQLSIRARKRSMRQQSGMHWNRLQAAQTHRRHSQVEQTATSRFRKSRAAEARRRRGLAAQERVRLHLSLKLHAWCRPLPWGVCVSHEMWTHAASGFAPLFVPVFH